MDKAVHSFLVNQCDSILNCNVTSHKKQICSTLWTVLHSQEGNLHRDNGYMANVLEGKLGIRITPMLVFWSHP